MNKKDTKNQVRVIGSVLRSCGFVNNTVFDRENIRDLEIVIRRLINTHGYDLTLRATQNFANNRPRKDIVRKAPYYSSAMESEIFVLKQTPQEKKQVVDYKNVNVDYYISLVENKNVIELQRPELFEIYEGIGKEVFYKYLVLTGQKLPQKNADIIITLFEMMTSKKVKDVFNTHRGQLLRKYFNADLTPKENAF